MSRDSSTRSAARATSFAPERVPIRWRLAGGSALLTLIILCGFAGAVGVLTFERIHEDFDDDVASGANRLQSQLHYDQLGVNPVTGRMQFSGLRPDLEYFDAGRGTVIRIVTKDGTVVRPPSAPADLGPPIYAGVEYNGYRIETRQLPRGPLDAALFVQFARPVADVEATIRRVRLFLVLGVLGGAGLALLAGLVVARRAMAPIAQLTAAAREIERTGDPARRIPEIEADDEVAELAHTLDGMLQALDKSRSETEAALARQREFVADASHELRTPLDQRPGQPRAARRPAGGRAGEAASLGAALLPAHAPAGRRPAAARAGRCGPRDAHHPTDVGQVLVEAAGELGAVAGDHELHVDGRRAVVDGARDELHRLALNLMENAVRHTPPGTRCAPRVERRNGKVRIVVEDDGPGIPSYLRDRVFDRFVRGTGDRGGSAGLGLAIVRAVAESHGGEVALESPTTNGIGPRRGTRFTVSLPMAGTATPAEPEPQPPAPVRASMVDSESPHSWMAARAGAGSPQEPSPMPPASPSGFLRRPASVLAAPTSAAYSESTI